MYNTHNALFCCPTFQQAYDNGVKSQHECTKDPVYVVEGANVPKQSTNKPDMYNFSENLYVCTKYETQS